jgi:thioredoxin reductase (NADPH)
MTYDVAIIGAGPAGLAAAVYGACGRAGDGAGGRARRRRQDRHDLQTRELPGLPGRDQRRGVRQRAYIQALRFGASIILPATATGLSGDATARVIHLDTGDTLTAHSVIIATGVTYRKIGATGLGPIRRARRVLLPAGVDAEIHPGTPW